MGDKGKKDKSRRENKKAPKLTLEREAQTKERKAPGEVNQTLRTFGRAERFIGF